MLIEKLSIPEITKDLKPAIDVIAMESIPSTNDYMWELIAKNKGVLPRAAVLAETQTSGKGRNGRNWVSPQGNIYLSVYWPFHGDHQALYGLSLVVGIAIARVLKSNGLHDVELKWPNDIYWQSHKMGGILIETKPNISKTIDVVIGIGLNIVAMLEPVQNITQKVAALEMALGHKISRNKLIAQLLNELHIVLEIFSKEQFAAFIAEWKEFEAQISRNSAAILNQIDQIIYAKQDSLGG